MRPVPYSSGTRRPRLAAPAGACDCHMHIYDPRFRPSPHWKQVPPEAPVATYRQPDLGAEPVGSTSAEFSAFLASETAKWSKVIKDANIKVD